MQMTITTLRDEVLDTYARPMFTRTVAEATRSFVDEANNPESQINKFPSDYTLYELGSYDDQTGAFTLLKAPRLVCRATDHIRQQSLLPETSSKLTLAK